MVVRFGVRRGGLSSSFGGTEGVRRAARVGCCALVLALVACSGEVLVVAQERPRPPSGTDEPQGPGGTDATPPPDVALLEDCPESPGERRELLGCWPTPHLGVWRGFFTGAPQYETSAGPVAFPAGDVALLLGIDGTGQLSFGLPPRSPAASIEVPSCDERELPSGCDQPGRLIPGFRYGLEQINLRDRWLEQESRIVGAPPLERPESMSFVVRAGEPWDAWCSAYAIEPEVEVSVCLANECQKGQRPAPTPDDSTAGNEPSCRCDERDCRAEATSLYIELSLSADGNSLRGAYEPGDIQLGEARLELRKEAAP